MKKTFIISMAVLSLLFSSCSTKTRGLDRSYYEIFVGSYKDSNSDKMGDLKGVEQSLNYLDKDLGISGIWLMPIMPSPTYHKYDVSDYYSIDKDYGTLKDFNSLAKQCDKRDIYLIIDMVINHCSSTHPLFVKAVNDIKNENFDSKEINYFNFSKEKKNYYHKIDGTSWYYEGSFTNEMPDWNLDNQDVRNMFLDICKFWIDNGADGFRLDAVTWFYNNNTSKNTDFLNFLYTSLKKYKEDVYLVGEAWSDGSTISALYKSKIPSLFNFPFSQSTGGLISSVRSNDGSSLASSLEKWYKNIPEGSFDAPFLSNHDNARSASALMGNIDLQKMAASVYLLLPGNPFIYYGEEIGMKGGSQNDMNKRTQFYWSNENEEGMCNPPIGTTDVREIEEGLDKQLKNPSSLVNTYIKVIKIRNKYSIIRNGKFKALNFENSQLFGYSLTKDNKTLIIIHNLGEERVTIKKEGKIIESFSTQNLKIENNNTNITLPKFSTVILSQ